MTSSYERNGTVISFPGPPVHDDNTIESFLNTLITQSERAEIESVIFSPLLELVKPAMPKPKPNAVIPRFQNSFIIFRKDSQARLLYENGPSFKAELKSVSSFAGKSWKGVSSEQKDTYEKVALIAKRVHKFLWPNYSYKPRKCKKRISPSSRRLRLRPIQPYPPSPLPPSPVPPPPLSLPLKLHQLEVDPNVCNEYDRKMSVRLIFNTF